MMVIPFEGSNAGFHLMSYSFTIIQTHSRKVSYTIFKDVAKLFLLNHYGIYGIKMKYKIKIIYFLFQIGVYKLIYIIVCMKFIINIVNCENILFYDDIDIIIFMRCMLKVYISKSSNCCLIMNSLHKLFAIIYLVLVVKRTTYASFLESQKTKELLKR